MRSSVLLAALVLADAVRTNPEVYPPYVNKFLGGALMLFFILDMIEVFRKKGKPW